MFGLEKDLSNDREEREKTLLQIKTLSMRYQFREEDEQLFLNYSIPAIYAIWEGFIQSSFKMYIQELNTLNLKIDTICHSLLIYHMEITFKQFNEYPTKLPKKINFFENLHQCYQSEFINLTRIIDTKSNVGFQVLQDLLTTFNLSVIPEYTENKYALKQNLDLFLQTRNAVAHGQNSIIVRRTDIEQSIELIQKLMELVCTNILRGYHDQTYLRT